MDKKHQKCPTKVFFLQICHPQDFFQKSAFVPLWCTKFMHKIRKILKAVSEIFKDGPRTDGRTDRPRTDGPTTDGHGWLHRTPTGKPGVQNVCTSKLKFFIILPIMMTPIDVWSFYIKLKVHYKDNQEPFQQFLDLSKNLQGVAGVISWGNLALFFSFFLY